jgi:light-harvesting complex II chlorophyll a/b binding protein 4
MVGDIGFDPLCLTAYSWPVFQEKGMNLFGPKKFGLLLQLPDLSSENRKTIFTELPHEEQQKAVMWMREAELKHARLAMLAAAGWPLGELTNWGFLHSYGDLHGRTPSLFNGGLLEVYGGMWLVFLAAASYVELTSVNGSMGENGDYNFDPLQMSDKLPLDKKSLELSELKNGRVAMMAITGFAVQEALWGNPVVEQTGAFFGRF